MVGFPGETDEDFRETVRLLERLPLAYLHVFPFSPRPGTPAVTMPDQIPGPVARERARELVALGERRWAAYLKGLAGHVLDVVVERVEGGLARGPRAATRPSAGPPPTSGAARSCGSAIEASDRQECFGISARTFASRLAAMSLAERCEHLGRAMDPRRSALALAAAGCGRLRGLPSAGAGWLRYRAGALTLELPEDWSARGDAVADQGRAFGRRGAAEGRARRAALHVRGRLPGPGRAGARRGAAPGSSGAAGHPTRWAGGPRSCRRATARRGTAGRGPPATAPAVPALLRGRLADADAAIFAAQRGVEGSLRFDGAR